MNNNITNKTWWYATGIRLLRTFLTTIMGCWTADKLVTEVDWRATLIAAVSSTLYIFIACLIAGLPEVDTAELLGTRMQTLYDEYDDFEFEEMQEEKESEVQ